MGVVRTALTVVCVISLVTFCALFGALPRFRKTPIGYANRLIWIHLPGTFVVLDGWITGGRSTNWLKSTGNYLMDANHPFVLIFYLSLVVGGEILMVPRVWQLLTPWQQAVFAILMGLPYVFTYLTVSSTASIITPENHHEEMLRYPYDHIIYYPGIYCRTCRHLKPARSKHCRICNVCVSKMDHHCPWVMTCLGKDNYRWFLLMLLSLGVLLIYGAHVGYNVLWDYLQKEYNIKNRPAHIKWDQGMTFYEKLNGFGWAFLWDIRIGMVSLLAAFCAPLALGLLLYHVYLIWVGVTTNESFKWDDWKEDVRDGYVFVAKGRRQPAGEDTEPAVKWQNNSDQILIDRAIKISRDRFPPDIVLQEPEWSRVESMRDIDNIYDLGFLGNLQEIFQL